MAMEPDQPGVFFVLVVAGGGGQGVFIYDASGNLADSMALLQNVDPLTSSNVPGITNYTKIGPSLYQAVSLDAGSILFLASMAATGPWNFEAGVSQGLGGLQVLGGTSNGFSVIFPSGDLTGATDAANIANAISSGPVLLSPGDFYANSTIPLTSGQYLRGSGRWSTFLHWVGTGDCIRAVDATAYNARTIHGGGVTGMTIDGAGAGAFSDAIHAGDIFQWEVDVIVQNFSKTGDIGVFFDNQNFWTEQLRGRIFAQNCTTGVLFSCGGALTSTGSYDRMALDICLNQLAGQIGVQFLNGAFAFGRLRIYGNMAAGSGGNAALVLSGQTPAGHPSSFSGLGNTGLGTIDLEIDIECDGAGTGPQTVFFGAGGNGLIGHGQVNFVNGGTPFVVSNNQGQFQFQGPVAGDVTLPSLDWYGSSGQVLTGNGQTLFANQGSVLRIAGAAPYTGLIVAPGAYDGQVLSILNQSGGAMTMGAAGVSNVANGVACVVPALAGVSLVWDASTSLWYETGAG